MTEPADNDQQPIGDALRAAAPLRRLPRRSGYWIGLQGIKAALQYRDASGPQELLDNTGRKRVFV